MDRPDQELLDIIASTGWAVITVSADALGPGFAYSIGLYATFQHPEIIIVGLDLDIAHGLINDIGSAIRQGAHMRAGETSDAFLEDYPCTFRRVPPHQYRAYLGRALWYYGDRPFPTLQLIYPDRLRRWPWEAGAHPGFRRQQPVLADEPAPPWASGPAA